MYMMAYAVHLLAITVHQVRLLIYMIGYAVHPSDWSEAFEVHVHQYTDSVVHLMANVVQQSEVPELYDGMYICSTIAGNCSTPE